MSKQVVIFHYNLLNTAGESMESSFNQMPLSFVEGCGQIITGLERELLALSKGDKKRIRVAVAEAYGYRDEELVNRVPRGKLPTVKVSVGDQLQVETDDGSLQVVVVKEVTESHVILDGNHPLAGQDLTFEVEIIDRRQATPEELAHGHVHGEGGHHH